MQSTVNEISHEKILGFYIKWLHTTVCFSRKDESDVFAETLLLECYDMLWYFRSWFGTNICKVALFRC